jgi:hypothetical protein
VLLAQLVHWARASGWIVMYTPDARRTLGHSYYMHDKQTDMYDTPDAACRVLKDLYSAHEAELVRARSHLFACRLCSVVQYAALRSLSSVQPYV